MGKSRFQRHKIKLAMLSLSILTLPFFSPMSHAMCKFEYAYKASDGTQKKISRTIQKGRKVTINMNDARYIKVIQPKTWQQAKRQQTLIITVDNALSMVGSPTKNVTLYAIPPSMQKDPPLGYYPSGIKLYQAHCK